MNDAVQGILEENARRRSVYGAVFDPLSGEGSIGERRRVMIPGVTASPCWLPLPMLDDPLVKGLLLAGSAESFLRNERNLVPTAAREEGVRGEFERVRMLHDFPYWAARFAYIKAKGGGDDVLFVLNRAQRKFVAALEEDRVAGRPLRLVLLKARQWGGSTCSQLYMAWLQLVHRKGLNSLIIAQQAMGSDEIKDMFDRMLASYPVTLLHAPGEKFKASEKKLVGVGRSGAIFKVPQRNCKIKVGTAERPDSCRGGDYNLVHCSEVGVWKATDGKTPEQIIRSACSGVLLRPYTMIVYESTANGTGNFFQREYEAAKRGESQFRPLFISWYDIDQYQEFPEDEEEFASRLLEMRGQTDARGDRMEPGCYLWWLWERGATLEAINWYVQERKKYSDHGQMASEYPSDDIEAFVHSGARVFDKYKVEALRANCRRPKYVGEIDAPAGAPGDSLSDLVFREDAQGNLAVWHLPDELPVDRRYLTVVDVGGRSSKSDWSVVVVFDRLYMIEGGRPMVVAQWRGHCDIDILAWKAARIARYYDDSLLVVESNTMETRDLFRLMEGDQSGYILSQIKEKYPNLYARRGKEDNVREGRASKYGFHTNVSTKPMIISNLVKVIRESGYVERDERCLDEYLVYERKPNGSYGAIPGKHDDLLMTRAIGLHICFAEMGLPAVRNVGCREVSRPSIRGEATFP